MSEHGSSGVDVEMTILGSGACNPSPFRSASALALRVKDSFWLFDTGEGTQIQLQRCMVRPAMVDKIFVTHAHGDHTFGLPGLLCLIARGRKQGAPPLQIYGPAGLRSFLRVALAFTGTKFLPRYIVHEIHQIPTARGSGPYRPPPPAAASAAVHSAAAQAAAHSAQWVPNPPTYLRSHGLWGGEDYGEQPGGRDLPPAEDGVSWWELLDEEGWSVRAAPLAHTAPCVGFVVEEAGKPGRLVPEVALPPLEANRVALREEWGVRDPRALLKRLAALAPGETLELPDGTSLSADDVQSPPRRGRKIAILGDCSDCSLMVPLARGADLLVHEATNAYLPTWGDRGGAANLERITVQHGHSTPQMAGRAAREMGAGTLLLNHFSQRYHPHQKGLMGTIARLAHGAAGYEEEGRVIAAYDSLTLPIYQPDRDKRIAPFERRADAVVAEDQYDPTAAPVCD